MNPHPPQWTTPPGPPGPPGPGHFGQPSGPGRSGGPRLPVWAWVVGGVGIVVIVALVVAVVAPTTASPDPAADTDERQEIITAAAAPMREWPGVTYTGRTTFLRGDAVDAEVTVGPDGAARGTLTRPQGGRAEVILARNATLVRGDRAWWSSKPAADAEQLTDRWVKNPIGDVYTSDLTRTFPALDVLRGELDGASGMSWYREEARVVDGVEAREMIGFSNRVVVDDSTSPPRLLSWSNALGARSGDGLRVSAADPDALAAAGAGADMIETTPTESDLRSGRVGARIERTGSSAACDPASCTFQIVVANADSVPAAGQIEFSIAGRPVGTGPFQVAPGGTATVEHRFPRPADLVAAGTFGWRARITR